MFAFLSSFLFFDLFSQKLTKSRVFCLHFSPNDSGQLVSLDEILALLKCAIQRRAATAKGFLIDGFPRQVRFCLQVFHSSLLVLTLALPVPYCN